MNELMDRITPHEFFLYMSYFAMKPIGTEDFYHGQQMHQMAQLKSTKKLKFEDFHPDWFEDYNANVNNPMTTLANIAAAGGKIIHKK